MKTYNHKSTIMLKIKSRITNPMTVIAIFAAISETSAAVSLPFLGNEDREFYVWFLVIFPFYLLFLFFLTLNFNHRSLYSPSDFNKDESFLKAIENSERNSRRNPSSRELRAQGISGFSSCILSGPPQTSPCKNKCRAHNVADPPSGDSVSSGPVVQHIIQLTTALRSLHMIDIRNLDTTKEVTAILEKIHHTDKKTDRVIVLISNHVSDVFLTQNALLPIKPAKKDTGATPYIVYNVCSQAITLLGRV